MSTEDKKHRSHLPMPNTARPTVHHLRREGPGQQVPAHRATAPAQGRAQRADHPHRRRRVRLVQRLRRPLPDADRGEAGGGRPEVQPLPHHRPLLADAPGAADRAQPPLRRHGRHHRDRHRRAGLLLGAAQLHVAAGARRSSSTATPRRSSASATRCRSGRRARSGRSTPGPRAAAASSTSTASSAARRTSGTRRSTRAPRRSSRRRRPRRATTSWRT